MEEPTCSQREAASVVFNLPGYDVIEAVDLPLGGRRRVVVQAIDRDEGCPDCGAISTKVHAWVKQQVRDIPAGGDTVEVVVRKRRMVCAEPACGRQTFTQATEQLPARARCLTRLREHLADAVLDSGRAITEVTGAFGVAWWTVQDAVDAAVVELPEVDHTRVRRLGVDEHRFGRARFFRDDATGRWQRVEPWMSTFVNTDTGQVLGIVDGRNSTGIQDWLDARTEAWRDRVEVVAIDPADPSEQRHHPPAPPVRRTPSRTRGATPCPSRFDTYRRLLITARSRAAAWPKSTVGRDCRRSHPPRRAAGGVR